MEPQKRQLLKYLKSSKMAGAVEKPPQQLVFLLKYLDDGDASLCPQRFQTK